MIDVSRDIALVPTVDRLLFRDFKQVPAAARILFLSGERTTEIFGDTRALWDVFLRKQSLASTRLS